MYPCSTESNFIVANLPHLKLLAYGHIDKRNGLDQDLTHKGARSLLVELLVTLDGDGTLVCSSSSSAAARLSVVALYAL